MSDYIVWFDQYTDTDRARVGGKNACLAELIAAGLPVPPGFAVTVEAYHSLRSDPSLVAFVGDAIGRIDFGDTRGLASTAAEIRTAVEAAPMEPRIVADIHEAYQALCEHCDVVDVPVAVRSSATAEDLPDASFAGQQDTYLWVTGADAVVEHVRRCWSSMFTDRALAYRHQTGYDHDVISMSVGVQKMVQPKAAGVAFTLNPSDGDRSQIAIDASWGLGEAVVSGEVTPDNFLVDKVIHEIVSRTISPKHVEYAVQGNTVAKVDIDPERQLMACLDDDEIRAVAAMARRAERHYGCPQDVEWAIDADLPPGERVVLLQSRPETVWSRKPATPIAGPRDPMASIVSTLMSPLHNQAE